MILFSNFPAKAFEFLTSWKVFENIWSMSRARYDLSLTNL